MGNILNKTAVLDRIKDYYSLERKVDLANFLDISSNTLSNWYTRGTLDLDVIYTKCEGIDFNWLFTGVKSKNTQSVKPYNDNLTINHEFIGSPYYNVDFIGGFDLILNDQTINPDFYINYPPYNKEGVVWVNLTGCSMEPELRPGDIVALKPVNTPIQYLPTNEIYAIVTDDYRTVKRIELSEREGFVRLRPSNPEYKEQEIPIEMISKVYAVLGSIRKFF